MDINHRQYAKGTGYCTAEGVSEDKPLAVEALDKLDAIIGWITESYERSKRFYDIPGFENVLIHKGNIS